MLHTFVFYDSNSGVTKGIILKVFKLCVIFTFQVKARYSYTDDRGDA